MNTTTQNREPAPVYMHPTATHSPDTVRRVEKASRRKAVLIDGWPMLVPVADADNHLPTGA